MVLDAADPWTLESSQHGLEHLTEEGRRAESAHYIAVRHSFMLYERYVGEWLRRSFYRGVGLLSEAERALVPHWADMRAPGSMYARLLAASKSNQKLLDYIVQNSHTHNFLTPDQHDPELHLRCQPTEGDFQKVRGTLKQFVRDWSHDGAEERSACYRPVIELLAAEFHSGALRNRTKVLVPGSGLGRLLFELVRLGFIVQGNEVSVHMLMGADWILNSCSQRLSCTLYPALLNLLNQPSCETIVRPVAVPDVVPSSDLVSEDGELVNGGAMSLVAGDFIEVYAIPAQKSRWQAVVTSFFIDTGKNILLYIRIISELIGEGGVWVNCGPLLYHYSDMIGDASVELPWSDVRSAIVAAGFDFEVEYTAPATYCSNKTSLFRTSYDVIIFKARKTNRPSSFAPFSPESPARIVVPPLYARSVAEQVFENYVNENSSGSAPSACRGSTPSDPPAAAATPANTPPAETSPDSIP